MDGAGHDVARRKLGGWMHRRHEALAASIHQQGAIAAYRFRGERGRIAPDIESGRVELYEFRIGDNRAGARGHGKAAAIGFLGVGRYPVSWPIPPVAKTTAQPGKNEARPGSPVRLA